MCARACVWVCREEGRRRCDKFVKLVYPFNVKQTAFKQIDKKAVGPDL